MRRALFLACSLLIAAPSAQAELRHAGNVVGTVTSGSRIDLFLDNGPMIRLEVLADDTLHVEFAPDGLPRGSTTSALAGEQPLSTSATIDNTFGFISIAAQRFFALVVKQPYRLVVWRPDGSLLQADLDPAISWDPQTRVVYTRKWAPPEERYYGLGERGGPLGRRGRSFTMRNEDHAAFGPLTDPLYITIPYIWGARGADTYGVFMDEAAAPYFSVDADGSGTLLFGGVSGGLSYYLLPGPAPAQVAEAYGHLTGFSTLPPRWTLGYHQSRYGYDSQQRVLSVAETLRALQIPADAIYFDIDYLDRLQMFSWNTTTFPDPIGMNARLAGLGFKRVNIMEPLVHTGDRFWQPLADAGYFLKKPSGAPLVNDIWFGTVSWLDFTKTAAASWYRGLLAAFLSTGIDAVWNDLNEPASNSMPDAVYDFDGHPRLDVEARNLYALREAEQSYLAQRDLRPNMRPWGISRSGFAGIQRYMANWGGDALSDWDTLRDNVRTSLSMALSGQNFFGHDIGGFLGSPDAELFTRWMEFSAFTPLFRNHAMNTSLDREPWAFGEPTLSRARTIINNRYRLLPYLYTLFERASRTGAPAIAPAFFHFPGDAATWNEDTEFMVGESMLVAPVLWQGIDVRPVYLPAGASWYDARSDLVYGGGAIHTVPAPVGDTPVFVRAPAVIPKAPVTQHTGERPLTEPELHLYRAGGTFDTSYALYEDDGQSFDYTEGVYLRTRIAFSGTGTSERVVISRAEGRYVPPAGRAWTLELHGTPAASLVTLGGAPIPFFPSLSELSAAPAGWTVAGGHVIVRVADAASPLTIETSHVALP